MVDTAAALAKYITEQEGGGKGGGHLLLSFRSRIKQDICLPVVLRIRLANALLSDIQTGQAGNKTALLLKFIVSE